MKYLIHVAFASLYSLNDFFSLMKIVIFQYVHSCIASCPENISITCMCVGGEGLGVYIGGVVWICVCMHVCMCCEIKDSWKETS